MGGGVVQGRQEGEARKEDIVEVAGVDAIGVMRKDYGSREEGEDRGVARSPIT
jgi:hypothetical protein